MAREGEKWRYGDKVENQRQKYEKIFRRIGKFKKYIHDLCTVISNHTVKVAGLRDRNDEVAKCLDTYTKIEEFSTTSKLSMAVVAELVATVGDHQDLAVQRIETLVLPNLSSYARICDCIKADVWNAIQAIRREKRKRKCVKTLRKKSDDPKTKCYLNDAQRELERASAETARFCHLSEEQVLKFEHKRLIDLKESLGTFIKVQIATYSKSLELLSETYKQIQSIDENGDLDILKHSLKIGRESNASKRSSDSLLKQSKSKKSVEATETSRKSSGSNFKEKSGRSKLNMIEEGESSSAEDISDDSSHSEVVRHLEKVLHSNHEISSKHDEKDQRPSTRRSARESPPSGRNGKNNHHEEKADNRKDHEKRKKYRERNLSDEDFITVHPQMRSKRPSTPTRPLTVPASRRRSSPEDLTPRRDDFSAHGKTKTYKKPHATTTSALDSYYYSQSEDEKWGIQGKSGGTLQSPSGRKMPATCTSLKEAKHVTFYNPNLDSGTKTPSISPLMPADSRQAMIGRGRDAGDYNTTKPKRLQLSNHTMPSHSSLRNYC